MNLRVGLLGAGSWGTTVAALVSPKAPTVIWARTSDVAREINEQHTNGRYLPDVALPRPLSASDSIEETVRNADVVVMAVPSIGFRAVLEEVKRHLRAWVPVVSLSKGLEESSHLRMTQLIEELLPGHPAGVLTGPNLAREIMGGYAAAAVVALDDETIVKELQRLFTCGLFRVYTNHDVVGCEIAGALKNVIAIAAGMGDGMGVGANTRSAVITRGLAELTRLGVAMGGEPATFAGLAGMGDLIATCTSPQSRNRHVGVELGKGRPIAEILADMHMVAEGVKTSRVVVELAARYEVEVPIAREVHAVIYENRSARQAYRGLLRRGAGSERDPG
jgi:glycerol-3-phosphate dehydrogenase (NAD(P)+)